MIAQILWLLSWPLLIYISWLLISVVIKNTDDQKQ